MKSNLYIPKKIHVGFQKRGDTFTGKLAYVIYEDEKGVLRKKNSWDGWRDKKIQEVVLDNNPARFVFNKGVQRNGHFGSGRSVMRVYDTRDFEFEITIDNLVGILMHSDISKRDITEECVFAWSGKDLVLLPVNSEEYRSSVEYTDKQSLTVTTKDLIKGYIYEKKKSNENLMYMGYHEFFNTSYGEEHKSFGKKHIFYCVENQLFVTPIISTLARARVEEVQDNFAEIDKLLHDSVHLQEFKGFEITHNKKKKLDNYYSTEDMYKEVDNKVVKVSILTYYSKKEVKPESVYFSVAEFQKKGKNSSLNFEQIKQENDIDKIVKDIGVNWSYEKEKSYYARNVLKGKTYSYKEFVQALVENGYKNEITAVNVLNEKKVWF